MKKLTSITALLFILSLSTAAFAQTDKDSKKDEMQSYMEEALSKLPEADAQKFRDTMKEAHEKNMAIADRIHGLHDDLDDILSADSFDKSAFLATSKKLREVYHEMRENTDNAFADAAAKLTTQERKTLVAAMAYPHAKHKAQ